MRLWTIQHKSVWDALLDDHVFFASKNRIDAKDFEVPYQWMEKMAAKLIKDWKVTSRPIWTWTTKPDLRNYRFIKVPRSPKEQEFVLIELEVPEDKVLLSDFDMWHLPLNNSPITYTEKQWDRVKGNLSQKEMEKTWERCLIRTDKYFDKFDPKWVGEKSSKVQGIINCLKIEQIIGVKSFKVINKA